MELVREPSVVVRGEVSSAMVEYALEKIRKVAVEAPGPILDADVRLDHHADPARERPHHVEMTLNLDGRLVRAHRSAATMSEAIDFTVDRLRRQVEATAERPQSLVLRHRDGTSWHHDDRRAHRPGYFPRPVEERGVVRRKTFALRRESIEDALFDLEALDHDFFLFVNDETGEENVVYHDDGAYAIAQPTATPSAIADVGVPVRSAPGPAQMRVFDACATLDLSGAPFLFFLDADTGRGHVAYRRYDGHYGLISPD